MYIVSVSFYFGENSAMLKGSSRLSSKSIGISRKMEGETEYDGETSEGVPYSFAYSSLAVQSHLDVKIVALQVPDSQTDGNNF